MTSVSLLKGADSALSAVPILGFMRKKGQDLVDWRLQKDREGWLVSEEQ